MNAEAQYFQYLAQSAGTDSRARRRPTPEFTDWNFLTEWERSMQPKKKFPKSQNEPLEENLSNPQEPIPKYDTPPQSQDESPETTHEIDEQHKQSRKDNGMFQRYIIPVSVLIGALIFSILSHSFFSAAGNFVKNVLEAFLVLFVFRPDQLRALIEILWGCFKCLENFPQFY
ncbi:uncharacterized protein EAE98_000122 [Botrytis deweyae]|uniref:Uncharacterized protein n=1 Tax=Botrytis deweyae TaxID=2478750 RepID=A0ABQ7J1S6_9HELO|nr:uncharacterized protein EAE98_000122 [Botrytis deweyae]KAF7939995.1 hypothetical protein EAE98_000122 [Botrytis deweyae]